MTLTPTVKLNLVIAAIIQAIHSTFPVLQLTGVIHVTSDTVAAVELAVGSYVTLAGLIVALFVLKASSTDQLPALDVPTPAWAVVEPDPIAARTSSLTPDQLPPAPANPVLPIRSIP